MVNENKGNLTKQKILQSANDLFAKNGFAGTSVRDIASKANVNLAAINYHFNNKETLYNKVFEYNYDHIKHQVQKLGETCKTTVELVNAVFQFFISSESAIMNTFKIFLSDSVGADHVELTFDEKEDFGPPGQDVFLEKISNDLGDEIPASSKRWAVKMIFSLLVHFGVVLHTRLMKTKCLTDEELKPEAIEEALRHSVLAHLQYLKSNPNL